MAQLFDMSNIGNVPTPRYKDGNPYQIPSYNDYAQHRQEYQRGFEQSVQGAMNNRQAAMAEAAAATGGPRRPFEALPPLPQTPRPAVNPATTPRAANTPSIPRGAGMGSIAGAGAVAALAGALFNPDAMGKAINSYPGQTLDKYKHGFDPEGYKAARRARAERGEELGPLEGPGQLFDPFLANPFIPGSRRYRDPRVKPKFPESAKPQNNRPPTPDVPVFYGETGKLYFATGTYTYDLGGGRVGNGACDVGAYPGPVRIGTEGRFIYLYAADGRKIEVGGYRDVDLVSVNVYGRQQGTTGPAPTTQAQPAAPPAPKSADPTQGPQPLEPGIVFPSAPKPQPKPTPRPNPAPQTPNQPQTTPQTTPQGNPAPANQPTPTPTPTPTPAPKPSPSPSPSPAPRPAHPTPSSPTGGSGIGGNSTAGAGGSTQSRTSPVPEPQQKPKESSFPVPFPPVLPNPQLKPPTPPNTPPPTDPNPCRTPCSRATFDKLDQLQLGLQGLDLGASAGLNAKLDKIDAKLGAQLPGGISGFLTRLGKWLQVDRLLNLMNTAIVLHNAYMLSNAISQTLFSAINNVLQTFGLKDSEGQDIDASKVVGNAIDSFAKSILGVETVDGIKKEWKKYSRIYQAAANIVFSLQSIGYSILEALETVGQYVAKIGNALRKFGVVTEKAFGWMNPNLNFTTNRFFNALYKTQEAVEAIDQISGEVLNIKETGDELKKQTTELQNAVKGVDANGTATPKKESSPENTPTKTSETANKTTSQSPNISPTDTNKPTV